MTQQEHWQIDGSVASNYERHLVPSVFGPWASDLLERAAPQLGDHVLDVACGTGAVTRLAALSAGNTGHVVGVDSNREMIAVARLVTSEEAIEWREGDVMALPFPDGVFDLVLCQQGLPFFPDPGGALAEMYRVTRQGGRLALTVWRSLQHNPGFKALVEAVERHCGPGAAATVRAAFALDNAEELASLVQRAGFVNVELQPARKSVCFPSPETFVRYYDAGSPLQHAIARLPEERRLMLINEVRSALRPYTVNADVRLPMEAHLVRAQKPAGERRANGLPAIQADTAQQPSLPR